MDGLPRMPWPQIRTFAKQIGPPILNAPSKRRFPNPYEAHPLALFTPAVNTCTIPTARWVHTDNEGKASVLVFTDGAAPGNGQPGVRAGCGVVSSPIYPGMSFALERSPEGFHATSNRAELRAAIAAVTMRYWPGEGFIRLVIVTDSEYVVKGVSEWAPKWKGNGWRIANGGTVKNQDLWKILLEKVGEYEADGFSVQFFQVKREWNTQADGCARRGAVSDQMHFMQWILTNMRAVEH
jgi:ribonuclease HI